MKNLITSSKNVHLIGIMGQSNAVGLGAVGTQNVPDTATYSPKFGQYIFNPQTLAWEKLQQNYNNAGGSTTFTGYTGIEMVLMDMLYDYYGTDQYVIKYGAGGTPISTTTGDPLNWSPDSTNELMFKGAVANHKSAIAQFPLVDKKMEVLIWIQGENDAPDAVDYATNFENFIDQWKNQTGNPNLKVLQTSLSNNQGSYSTTSKAIINNAKMVYAINGNKYVSTDGCQVGADSTHFTPYGYQIIAERIFPYLIKMLG